MRLKKLFYCGASLVLALFFAACNDMSNPVYAPSSANVSSGSSAKDYVYMLRYGASVDNILRPNVAEWNKTLSQEDELYFAFESEYTQKVVSVEVLLELTDSDDHDYAEISGNNIGSNGNTWWAKFPNKLTDGIWSAKVTASYENGGRSPLLAVRVVVGNSELTDPNTPTEPPVEPDTPTEPPVDPDQPTDPNPPIDPPVDPNPPIDPPTEPNPPTVEPSGPRISDFRWNTTGAVKESDKDQWSPAVIKYGSRLWIGLHSTEVATSIKFIVYKNAVSESYDMTPGKYPNYVGLGTNNGFVWAMFPTTMDFEGELRIRVEVNFADGKSEDASGTLRVEKEAQISNLRWGATADSVKAANKANWNNGALREDNELYSAVDFVAPLGTSIEQFRFTIFKGDLEETYTKTASSGAFTIEGNSVFMKLPAAKIGYVGQVKVKVEIKFSNNVVKTLESRSVTVTYKQELSNLRWGTTAASIRTANKANWNKEALREDYELYAAVDFDTSEGISIEHFRFYIYKGFTEEYYTRTASSGGFIIDGKSVFMKLPVVKIDYTGQIRIKVEIKFSTGTLKAIESGNITVAEKPYALGDLRRLTFEQTGLPASVNANGGYEYYEFGIWPQSLRQRYVMFTTREKYPHNPDWHKGTDGWYEYVTVSTTYRDRTFQTADGREIRDNTDYFFKVEPIIWQRIPGTNKLISAKVLGNRAFYGSTRWVRYIGNRAVYTSNYHYSDIRAWLNGLQNQSITDGLTTEPYGRGSPAKSTTIDHDYRNKGFINFAFTNEQRNLLQAIEVENGKYDNHIDYVYKDYKMKDAYMLAPNGRDKVWLWSKQEISRPGWFGASGEMGFATNRRKPVTDYAIATGVNNSREGGANYGPWWLRSPNWNNTGAAQTVYDDGHANSDRLWAHTTDTTVGIVPGIQLPADLLNTAPRKQ